MADQMSAPAGMSVDAAGNVSYDIEAVLHTLGLKLDAGDSIEWAGTSVSIVGDAPGQLVAHAGAERAIILQEAGGYSSFVKSNYNDIVVTGGDEVVSIAPGSDHAGPRSVLHSLPLGYEPAHVVLTPRLNTGSTDRLFMSWEPHPTQPNLLFNVNAVMDDALQNLTAFTLSFAFSWVCIGER